MVAVDVVCCGWWSRIENIEQHRKYSELEGSKAKGRQSRAKRVYSGEKKQRNGARVYAAI